MEQTKSSKAYFVASIVSLAISGLSIVSLILVGVMLLFSGSGGGSATAITNEAVLGIAGILLFVACSWIFGGIGGLIGIVMTIIGLVKKYFKRIWMPILSIVLGVIPLLGAVLLLLVISQW